MTYALLDLTDMLNNIAFDGAGNTSAGFDCEGNMFPRWARKMAAKAIGELTVPFRCHVLSTEDNDNVSCDGQRIPLPAGSVTRLHVLGAGEHGDFIGRVRYCEEAAEIGKVSVCLSDWARTDSELRFGEAQVFHWRGRANARTRVYDEAPCGINWFQTDIVDWRVGENGRLVLPVNPCIHIFAITLEVDGSASENGGGARGTTPQRSMGAWDSYRVQ